MPAQVRRWRKIDSKMYWNGGGRLIRLRVNEYLISIFFPTSPWSIHAIPNLILAIPPVRWGSLHSYSVWIRVWVASCRSPIQINSGYFYISCEANPAQLITFWDNNRPRIKKGLANIFVVNSTVNVLQFAMLGLHTVVAFAILTEAESVLFRSN